MNPETMPKINWQPYPKQISIQKKEAHIWYAPLLPESYNIAEKYKILSADECARANRYKLDTDKIRFIIRRGVLREIVSDYLDILPGKVIFSYGKYGRPQIKDSVEGQGIDFNISSSGKILLCAVYKGVKAGIDIEKLKKTDEMADIVKNLFTSREYSKFQREPENIRAKLFYQLWTQKESYIKAIGKGLAYSLKDFEVSEQANDSGTSDVFTVNDYRDKAMKKSWSIKSFTPQDGYIASVAVQEQNPVINCYSFL